MAGELPVCIANGNCQYAQGSRECTDTKARIRELLSNTRRPVTPEWSSREVELDAHAEPVVKAMATMMASEVSCDNKKPEPVEISREALVSLGRDYLRNTGGPAVTSEDALLEIGKGFFQEAFGCPVVIVEGEPNA